MSSRIREIEISISGLSHEGRGIGLYNNKKVFVDNALPGEKVLAKINKQNSKYIEATAFEIKSKSVDRIEAACEHFTVCGGCALQHLSPIDQIKLKEKTLKEQFSKIKNIDNILMPAITADSFFYRRKARLGVRHVQKKEKVLVGFREKDSRFLADISSCKILTKPIADLITPLQELIKSLTVYNKIAQIEVACGDETDALIFRNIEALAKDDEEKLITFGKIYNLHIYLQPKGYDSVYKLYPDNGIFLQYRLEKYNLTFNFHPLDFIQVNKKINEQLIDKALELTAINTNDIVLDLFSGLGNFSLAFAKYANKVISIEGDVNMTALAKDNAKLNNINNCEFYTANLFEDDFGYQWIKNNFDVLVLDPPRAGALQVCENINLFQPKKILYISCNSSTLARDTEILLNKGYQLQKIGMLDMFPNTSHFETMALFTYTS